MDTSNTGPMLDRPWRRPGAVRYALGRLHGLIRPPVRVTVPAAGTIEIERDVPVTVRDGAVLRVNVYRPPGSGRHPVILSAHPYGKDALPSRRSRAKRWSVSFQFRIMRQPKPIEFSRLTTWEAPDPAFWVAQGYAVVNADLRGCGTSQGTGSVLSDKEGEDVYDLIEWAGEQPWSTGKVGCNGVSYLAISQYKAAALRPPSLRAICPWEGLSDAYRDLAYPGGVRERGFIRLWALGLRSTRQEVDLCAGQPEHPLRDAWWQALVPELAKIEAPALICGSFSDNCLHSRGSIRAFEQIGSAHRRLYTHRGGKWATYYSPEALAEQLAFFEEFLKGEPRKEPSASVRLEVRETGERIAEIREEQSWPLERTRWTALALGNGGELQTEPAEAPGSITFATIFQAAAFSWRFPADHELTGPMAARLWVEAHGCEDLDLFLGVEKWRSGRYIPFEGSYGYGRDRVATGWIRASLRALDQERSRPWDPVQAFTASEPLRPGEIVPLEIQLGPSSTVFRAGEELRLIIAGRWLSSRNPLTSQLPAAYPKAPRGRCTLHWGPKHPAHLLIPVIPAA